MFQLPPELHELHLERVQSLGTSKWALQLDALHSPIDLWSKAQALKPWKKGPFTFEGKVLDAQWRCDKKWARLLPHLPDLSDKTILDVGCGNGWYMRELQRLGAKDIVGFDPMPLNWIQWNFLQTIERHANSELYLLGVEELPKLLKSFDLILHMGVLYHHRNPIQQLIDLRESLVPGGTLILETIGVPGEENHAYLPDDRYAEMPNVWFLPTLSCLKTMLDRTRFTDIEVLSTHWEGIHEQRITPWCDGPSFEEALDPHDPTRTKEGHPAPERFMLKARRKP